jgi:ectoine hydroxylase-related dioxygenase (phytanoyl-CoA dioxygenase family)
MVGERYDIEGIPIEVVELTGRPGDVVVTHLHVFHCASPNTSDTPRQMLGKAVAAA